MNVNGKYLPENIDELDSETRMGIYKRAFLLFIHEQRNINRESILEALRYFVGFDFARSEMNVGVVKATSLLKDKLYPALLVGEQLHEKEVDVALLTFHLDTVLKEGEIARGGMLAEKQSDSNEVVFCSLISAFAYDPTSTDWDSK